MTDDDGRLGQRLRGQLEEELGHLQAPAGSRERLRRGMRKPRRSPWFRASILVPVAAALAIAALVLSIPALLTKHNDVELVPAGPAPVSTTLTPTRPPVATVEPSPARVKTPAAKKTTARPTQTRETPAAVRTSNGTPPRTATREQTKPAVVASVDESTTTSPTTTASPTSPRN